MIFAIDAESTESVAGIFPDGAKFALKASAPSQENPSSA